MPEHDNAFIYVEDPRTGQEMPFPKKNVKHLKPELTPETTHTIDTHDTENQWAGNQTGETENKGVKIPKKPTLEEIDIELTK
ncbi:MAG: hypothetical protein UX10_C0005G0007 [Candidatus Magasanikbacteria bacterium GW2011_GWA2_45_39]|uniref:Uncharacterized protein n=1 Tax=Candidatus Magasanikbacteria bacterium GW2011_GWA2_45_39 TaxID=1619041 RepID=A0A0G1MHF5_9BACT|nr:MAG: hypothetical protein UX10_C0005G0007 [Candidatus Magasanikbacteria bacterium GW2011_GWA2_45_39]